MNQILKWWVSSERIAWCIHFVDFIIEVEVVALTEIGLFVKHEKELNMVENFICIIHKS